MHQITKASVAAARKADPDGRIAARKIRQMRADRRARAIARQTPEQLAERNALKRSLGIPVEGE